MSQYVARGLRDRQSTFHGATSLHRAAPGHARIKCLPRSVHDAEVWRRFGGVCGNGPGLATRTLNGQAQATQAHAAEFQQDVLPVLAKSCLGCHSEKAQAGKLNLEPLRDPATTATHTAVWQKVLDKMSAGAMPPPTAKPLTRCRARGGGRVDQQAARPHRRDDAGPADGRACDGAPTQSRGIQQHDTRPSGRRSATRR